jgi:hypothetical protein
VLSCAQGISEFAHKCRLQISHNSETSDIIVYWISGTVAVSVSNIHIYLSIAYILVFTLNAVFQYFQSWPDRSTLSWPRSWWTDVGKNLQHPEGNKQCRNSQLLKQTQTFLGCLQVQFNQYKNVAIDQYNFAVALDNSWLKRDVQGRAGVLGKIVNRLIYVTLFNKLYISNPPGGSFHWILPFYRPKNNTLKKSRYKNIFYI